MRDVRIFDYYEDDDGKRKAVLNQQDTAIAQQKQKIIKQKFKGLDMVRSRTQRGSLQTV